jgi:hypothetical protein
VDEIQQYRHRTKAEVSPYVERFFLMRFDMSSPRVRLSASVALALSALGATLVAVLRYRATGIVGATFDKPLSDGTTRVFMYDNEGHWYAHFQLWFAVALILAAASILCGLLARRA